MNALKLADELVSINNAIEMEYNRFEKLDEAATMLRQQSDLIDVLRMGQPNIDYDKELLKPTFIGRELTDEEIIEIAKDCGYANRYELNIQFARAILRKAQEK